MADLTYQQVLADHYEETAKTVLVVANEYTEEVPPHDKHPDEIENQDDFKKFMPRHDLTTVTSPSKHEDKTKLSVLYEKQSQIKLINIDSRWRNGYGKGVPDITNPTGQKVFNQFISSSSSNFTFRLSEPIKNVISVRLSSIELPNSFYAFSKARGNVWFTVTYPSKYYDTNPSPGIVSGQPYTIYIPDGNWDSSIYNPYSLPQLGNSFSVPFDSTYSTSILFQVALSLNKWYSDPAHLPPGATPTTMGNSTITSPDNTNQFIVTLDAGTGKILIQAPQPVSGSASIKFDVNWSSDGQTYLNTDSATSGGIFETVNVPVTVADFGLGYNLGFRNLIYNNNSDLIPESILNVIDTNYVFLSLDPDWKVVFQETPLRTQLNAFAKVIINQTKFAVVYDNGANTLTKEYHLKQPTNIVNIPVRLSDPYDQDIDLNGMDFSFTLEVREVVDFSLYETMRN